MKGPNFGVVQVSVDGRPLGAPFDLYARRAAGRAAGLARHARALRGQAHAHDDGDGQERGVDRLPRAASTCSCSTRTAAPQPTPTAVATAEVGGTVPPTLALTLGAGAFGAFQPGVAREYTASHDGQRRLDRGRRGAHGLRPGPPAPTARSHAAPQPLRVRDRARRRGASRCPTAPCDDHVQAGDRRRRAAADRHATRRR